MGNRRSRSSIAGYGLGFTGAFFGSISDRHSCFCAGRGFRARRSDRLGPREAGAKRGIAIFPLVTLASCGFVQASEGLLAQSPRWHVDAGPSATGKVRPSAGHASASAHRHQNVTLMADCGPIYGGSCLPQDRALSCASCEPARGLTVMSRSSLALSNLRAVVILIVLAFHSVLPYLATLPATPYRFDERALSMAGRSRSSTASAGSASTCSAPGRTSA